MKVERLKPEIADHGPLATDYGPNEKQKAERRKQKAERRNITFNIQQTPVRPLMHTNRHE